MGSTIQCFPPPRPIPFYLPSPVSVVGLVPPPIAPSITQGGCCTRLTAMIRQLRNTRTAKYVGNLVLSVMDYLRAIPQWTADTVGGVIAGFIYPTRYRHRFEGLLRRSSLQIKNPTALLPYLEDRPQVEQVEALWNSFLEECLMEWRFLLGVQTIMLK
jgi:hypothetical protein